MNQPIPFTWRCGTPACVGDIVGWGELVNYICEVYWSDYFESYQVRVGTGLTLSEGTIDEFRFIRRGAAPDNKAGNCHNWDGTQECRNCSLPWGWKEYRCRVDNADWRKQKDMQILKKKESDLAEQAKIT